MSDDAAAFRRGWNAGLEALAARLEELQPAPAAAFNIVQELIHVPPVDIVTSDRMIWNSALDRVLSEMAANRLYFDKIAKIIERLHR